MMKNKISFRPARPSDESFVNNLTRTCMTDYVKQTWPTQRDQDIYFRLNAFDLNTTQIIQLDDKDIGRLSLVSSEKNLLIDNIHILPEYQNRGIGTQVIQEVIDTAKTQDRYVQLQLLRTNPVKSLYERLGFYVFGENDTHLLMRTR